MAFSSDSRSVITGTKLGSVKIWPIGERGEASPRTYAVLRGKIKHLAASPGAVFC